MPAENRLLVVLALLLFRQDCVISWLVAGTAAAAQQARHAHHRYRHFKPAASPFSNRAAYAPQALVAPIAACVAFKDQHDDISEWLEHHHKLGVRAFYIIDDGSSSPLERALEEWPESVELYLAAKDDFLGSKPHSDRGHQLTIYQSCLDKFRLRHQWMLFIDVDEYLVLVHPHAAVERPLEDFLQEFKHKAALAVNWQTFGSSGLLERPSSGVRASFWSCLPKAHPTNRHVKIIANLIYTASVGASPHEFVYEHNRTAVNEHHQAVEGPRTEEVSVTRIALYHYAIRSLAEFHSKEQRGSGMGNQKTMEYFDLTNRDATNNCTLLLSRRSRPQSRSPPALPTATPA